jgi:hypothetical protein
MKNILLILIIGVLTTAVLAMCHVSSHNITFDPASSVGANRSGQSGF